MSKRSVLVLSPKRKCALDLKVRGILSERSVKTLASGELRVRVGNRWRAVTEVAPIVPLRLVVPMGETDIPGLR